MMKTAVVLAAAAMIGLSLLSGQAIAQGAQQTITPDQMRAGQGHQGPGQHQPPAQAQQPGQLPPGQGQGYVQAPGAGQGQMANRPDLSRVMTGFRASEIVGSSVYNDANESIGSVDDLIVTPDGKAPFAVLSVGGFLGMGSRLVAIPYDSLKFAENRILFPGATRDELKGLPEFRYTK